VFTGIITATGRVTKTETARADGSHTLERTLTLATPYADAVLGESIAVNGVCLTVVQKVDSSRGTELCFFVSSETCDRSNLGSLSEGDEVNLERALRATDRLSGHIVQGHVDGLARVTRIERQNESVLLGVSIPAVLQKYLVEKGSITLDGISLTINALAEGEAVLTIIPHTWNHTTLKTKKVGRDLNLEVDVIAKHVEKLTNAYHR